MSCVLSIRIIIEIVYIDMMVHLAVAIVVQNGTDGSIDRELKQWVSLGRDKGMRQSPVPSLYPGEISAYRNMRSFCLEEGDRR